MLPRWRGAAPIQRAIEAGDTETGITIMQMDAGLDTGAMRLVRKLAIGPEETGGQLHDRLAVLGGEAIVEALALLERQALPSHPQPDTGVTYAGKLLPEHRQLDWTLSAVALHDRIRAFDPVPGCAARLRSSPETPIKIWASGARPQMDVSPCKPGTILAADSAQVLVACGDGALALQELQRPGGKRLPVEAFQRGHPIVKNDVFI